MEKDNYKKEDYNREEDKVKERIRTQLIEDETSIYEVDLNCMLLHDYNNELKK